MVANGQLEASADYACLIGDSPHDIAAGKKRGLDRGSPLVSLREDLTRASADFFSNRRPRV
jgi:phosphoglycolate phosphatase-like HAD superfamily hydrolase